MKKMTYVWCVERVSLMMRCRYSVKPVAVGYMRGVYPLHMCMVYMMKYLKICIFVKKATDLFYIITHVPFYILDGTFV